MSKAVYKNMVNGKTYESTDQEIELMLAKGMPIKKVELPTVPDVLKDKQKKEVVEKE